MPARSPRKTRPSRRPPRSARPLVRPTSFMRTTMPRPPPAKAPRTMSRLRCAQSLHCTSASQAPAACRPRPVRRPHSQGDACGHCAMIAPASTLRMACPRHAVLSERADGRAMVHCNISPAGAFGQDDHHGALAFATTGLQPTAPSRVNTSGTRGTLCPLHQHCHSHRNAS